MSNQRTDRVAALLISTLLAVGLSACNMIEEQVAATQSGDREGSAKAAKSEESAGFEQSRGDITSLGPDSETRIYYQFIDEKGSVRFVERLDDVPEEWRDRVGYLELDAPPPLSPGDAERVREQRFASSGLASTRSRLRSSPAAIGSDGRAMDRFDRPGVILYYADWCGYCKKAKRHLDKDGIAYDLRDVDIPAIKKELYEKTGGGGIPVIDIEGRIMKGYNRERLNEMLDSV